MKVLFFGYGDMGCRGLEFLLREGESVVAVITHRDDPAEKKWFRSVAEEARAAGLKVFIGEDLQGGGLEKLARELDPDLILSCYYRRLIPEGVLHVPPRGALNLHGSLLPRLRGRAPVNWALVECEERTGVTLHHMVARPDAGDIVARRGFEIGPGDTALTLFRKSLEEAEILLREIWPRLRAGTAPRIPQDESLATYRGRRTPGDGRIDWSLSSRRIDGLVRAVTDPFPGAFTFLEGRKLMVWSGSIGKGSGPPGKVIGDSLVATGDGAYRIERCEFAGNRTGEPALVPGVQLG